jgi:hypothetical protein
MTETKQIFGDKIIEEENIEIFDFKSIYFKELEKNKLLEKEKEELQNIYNTELEEIKEKTEIVNNIKSKVFQLEGKKQIIFTEEKDIKAQKIQKYYKKKKLRKTFREIIENFKNSKEGKIRLDRLKIITDIFKVYEFYLTQKRKRKCMLKSWKL